MTKTGHAVMIHRSRTGDTFADASLFSERFHRTAIATCNSLVIECKRMAVTNLLNTDVGFAHTMMSRFAAQIQESRRRVELLSIWAAEERILTTLSDGPLVEDITSFADIIGLAPEAVYHVLAQLTQAGQIEKSARGQYHL